MSIRIINYRPPRIALLFVLTAILIHMMVPTHYLLLYSNHMLGIILAVAGFTVMMSGWWLFRKFDTAVCPTEKSEYLVTTGIYQYSRNPMYLGLFVMLIAIAVYVGTLPFYFAAVVFFMVINYFFRPYEENKLLKAFGESYIAYKNNVRCWL